jgi:hypothetical protein
MSSMPCVKRWVVELSSVSPSAISANHIFHRTFAFIICPAGILFTYVPADGEITAVPENNETHIFFFPITSENGTCPNLDFGPFFVF